MKARRGVLQLSAWSIRGETGFTLVELSCAGLLSVLIGGVLSSFLLAFSSALTTITGSAALQEQVRFASDALSEDTRLAAFLPTACCAGDGDYIQDLTNPAQRVTVIFQVSSINTTGDAIAGFDFLVYDFDATTGILQRIVRPSGGIRTRGGRVVARDLTSITFNLASPGELTATFVASRTEGGRPFTATLVSRSKFRNPIEALDAP